MISSDEIVTRPDARTPAKRRVRLNPAVELEAGAVALALVAWISARGASSWMLRTYSEASWLFLFASLGALMLLAAALPRRPLWYALLLVGASVYAGLGVIALRAHAPAESCVFLVNAGFLAVAFWRQKAA